MTELFNSIVQRAERGDALMIRSHAFIPLEKEAVWRGRKENFGVTYHQPGLRRLISPHNGWSMVESGENAVALSRLVAERPDLFIGPQVGTTVLPFEVSRVVTGTWDAATLLTSLCGVVKHTSREELRGDLMVKAERAVRYGNHAELYNAALGSFARVKGLKRDSCVSDEMFENVRMAMQGFLDGGLAVRVNYPPDGARLGNTVVMVQNAVRGAGLYLGLKEQICEDDWVSLMTGGKSIRDWLSFDAVEPGHCRSIPPGIPYGATGDMELMMIEGFPRESAFVYDWERQSFPKLMKRARDRAKDVRVTVPTLAEEQRRFKFWAPSGKRKGIIQRQTSTYEMMRVTFGRDDEYQWTVEMGDRAAYVVGLGGWVTITTRSNSLRLSPYEAVFLPPFAGSQPNVFSITGSGISSHALIVRPL